LSNQLFAEINDGTIDNPYHIRCDTCFSDSEYTTKATEATGRNQTRYYVIYNVDTQTLKTVFSFSLFEPELGLNRTTSRIVSTSAANQSEFQEFLNYLATQRFEKTFEYDYPATGPNGAPSWDAVSAAPSLVLQQTMSVVISKEAYVTTDSLTIVTTFQDGGKVYMARIGDPRSIAGYQILLVADAEGNPIIFFAANGSNIQHFNGGAGNAGGYTDIILPGGVKYCYGECPIRDQIIIIERTPQ